MPIAGEKLKKILQKSFPEAKIELVALVDDDNHYSLTITDSIFAGKKRVEQHKIVNNALKEVIGDTLHAIQIKTIAK
jgi:stress-induced morphogen